MNSEPRVLVVHNRYRQAGGEERAVALQLEALTQAGVPHASLERSSADVGRVRAARALLRGGEREEEVARATRDLRASVVHVHNMHPLFGPRALTAARAAGARVVLHLHNFRLFCSIAVAFRDGAPCFRCRGRLTFPGLALNCRGSVPESAAYTSALALHQPTVFAAVDRFATLSAYAAGQLTRLGVPQERLDVLPNYLPGREIADRSHADAGGYALIASRLSSEKGISVAIEAAAIARVPLKIAGSGPLAEELQAHAGRLSAPVEFLGEVTDAEVRALREHAALVAVPSLGGDVMPFAALEAMGQGVPVVAARSGSLPEIVGEERCVRRGDPLELARAMLSLWESPERRRTEGDALIARARERYSERRYLKQLLAIYSRAEEGSAAHA